MGTANKVILVLLGLVALAAMCPVILFLWARNDSIQHEKRIAKATHLMKTYGDAEWKEVYEECVFLYDHKISWPEPGKKWPKRVAELNPHGVNLSDNTVYMYWTGGFDDFHLSLEAVLDHSSPRLGMDGPGIWVQDTRGPESGSDLDPQCVYRPATKVTVTK